MPENNYKKESFEEEIDIDCENEIRANRKKINKRTISRDSKTQKETATPPNVVQLGNSGTYLSLKKTESPYRIKKMN